MHAYLMALAASLALASPSFADVINKNTLSTGTFLKLTFHTIGTETTTEGNKTEKLENAGYGEQHELLLHVSEADEYFLFSEPCEGRGSGQIMDIIHGHRGVRLSNGKEVSFKLPHCNVDSDGLSYSTDVSGSATLSRDGASAKLVVTTNVALHMENRKPSVQITKQKRTELIAVAFTFQRKTGTYRTCTISDAIFQRQSHDSGEDRSSGYSWDTRSFSSRRLYEVVDCRESAPLAQ